MEYDTSRRSPNFWTPATLQAHGIRRVPRFIVIHTTEGAYPSDLNYLCDPDSEVSAHVYISRNPDHKPFELVDPANVAWHGYVPKEKRTARTDLWARIAAQQPPGSDPNVNYHSLAIELEARRGQAVTPQQWNKALAVVSDWLTRFPTIEQNRSAIFGHYELNNQKVDPLPWNWGAFMDDLRAFRQQQPFPSPPTLQQEGDPVTARFFPETGKTMRSPFLEFWTANGGLAMFGFPLTGAEADPDNPGVTVQFCENVMLEDRPGTVGYPRVGAGVRRYLKAVGRL